MSNIYLFSILILCNIAMFLYFYRRINYKLNNHKVNDDMSKNLLQLETRLETIRDNTAGNEAFFTSVNTEIDNKILQIQDAKSSIENNYKDWESLFSRINLLAEDLNNKESTYNEMCNSLSVAENYQNEFFNRFAQCTDLFSRMDSYKKSIVQAADELENKRASIEQEAATQLSNFLTQVVEYKDINTNAIHRELESVKKFELNKIQKEVDILFQHCDNQHSEFVKNTQHELQDLFETFEKQFTDIEQKIKNDAQDIENVVISEKESLEAYVLDQSNKLSQLGDECYLQLQQKLDDKQDTIDHRLIVMDEAINKRIQDIQHNSEQLSANIMESINKLNGVIKVSEEDTNAKVTSIHNYVKDMHSKLRQDYDFLDKEKNELSNIISALNSEVVRLESQVSDQLNTKHQEYIGNVGVLINNIQEQLELDKQDKHRHLTELFKDAENSTREKIQNLSEDHDKFIQRDIEEFNNNFIMLTQQLSEKVEGFESGISDQISKTESQFDEKLAALDSRLQNYSSMFSEKLKMEGDDIIAKHMQAIQKRNESFMSEIESLTSSIEETKATQEENMQLIKVEYAKTLKALQDEREEFDSMTHSIGESNKKLRQELISAKERYQEFLKNYEAVKKQMGELKYEHEIVNKELVEANNIQGQVSVLITGYSKTERDLRESEKAMQRLKDKIENSLSQRKSDVAKLGQLEKKIDKISRYIDGVTVQEANVEKIRDMLHSVQHLQGEIQSNHKELAKWEKEYKSFTLSIENLQERCTKLLKQSDNVEANMRDWEEKVSTTNDDIMSIKKQYDTLQDMRTEVNALQQKMPDILSNMQKFMGIQEHALEVDNELQKTLQVAQQKINILGTVLDNDKSIIKQKSQVDSTQKATKKMILALHQENKWTEEVIAEVLKISVAEVKLVLEKSLIS